MAKPKYQHQLAGGRIATRDTKRTYTHVIIRTADWRSDGIPGTANYSGSFKPCEPYVAAWVGRPDLVAGALREATRHGCPPQHVTAEAINGGVRE